MLGRSIGPYEVTAPLGRGGMGEVFRARDTKLGRDVAVKILPAELAGEPERLARFQREARVLAALQHQNIAAIYGLEEADGSPVLIMELAEGEDLSTRLAGGALPAPEAEKIARQLARGLEYAHEKGIVHRDLKPANVKVSGDGDVKILDFGLARAFQAEGVAEPDSVDLPKATVTQALTGVGSVLGTAAYMSPEQARGYEVDRRSDIWAYGVIVYEMLTGVRLFEGETPTDTLAAVLHKEPDWAALPEETPPLLAHLLRRCLEKDPTQRLRDIGEARVALDGSTSSLAGWTPPSSLDLEAPPPPPSGRGALLPWVLCGLLAVACCAVAFLGVTGRLSSAPTPRPVQSRISLPDNHQLHLTPTAPAPGVLSPDGRRIVYGARDSLGIARLFVRDLAAREARPIPGTAQAAYPFWAPDSRTVAFFGQNNRMVKVDINGGPVVAICPAENGKGGAWGPDGTILFAPSHNSEIHAVDAGGGEPRAVTDLADGEGWRSHRFPQWLPDGRFQYTAVQRRADGGDFDSVIRVGDLNGGPSTDLMPTRTNVVMASDVVLHVHDGVLLVRPFDVARLEFTGPAEPLLSGVLSIGAAHLTSLSATDDVLIYSTGEGALSNAEFRRLAPDGTDRGIIGDSAMSVATEFSPDGRTLLLAMPDEQRGTFDLWMLDIERGVPSRFTLVAENEMAPIWSPDGAWVVYAGDHAGSFDLYRKRTDGSGEPELLYRDRRDIYPSDWLADGRIFCSAIDSVGDVSVAIFDPDEPDKLEPLRRSTYGMAMADASPDGRWVTYLSGETGTREVYVESMMPGGGRWRVSTGGGAHPRWSHAGDRITYLTPNGALMAVPVVERGGTLSVGEPASLTDSVIFSTYMTYSEDPVTGDLVVMKPVHSRTNTQLNLITHWRGLLDASGSPGSRP